MRVDVHIDVNMTEREREREKGFTNSETRRWYLLCSPWSSRQRDEPRWTSLRSVLEETRPRWQAEGAAPAVVQRDKVFASNVREWRGLAYIHLSSSTPRHGRVRITLRFRSPGVVTDDRHVAMEVRRLERMGKTLGAGFVPALRLGALV